MNKTVFRKAALTGCIVLTVWSGMPLGSLEALAQGYEVNTNAAQGSGYDFTNMFSNYNTQGSGTGFQLNTGSGGTGIGNISASEFFSNPGSLIQGGTSNLGQNITGLLQQGVNASSINNVVSQITGISQSTIGSITNMVSNIAGGQNVNASSFANLINQVTGGNITGKLGEVLSTVKNLGNITNLSNLTSLLSSKTLQDVMKNLNLGDLGKGLDTVLNSVLKMGGISNLLNSGAVKSITDAISKAFPDFAKALGIDKLTESVTKALQDIAGGKATEALSQAAAAAAGGGGGGGSSCSPQGCGGAPCQKCHTDIPLHYAEVRAEITSEFKKHRTWFLTTYWKEHILPALMLMAEQLSVAGIAQVNMFGAMLDAKHQLETQRLFQTLQAEAHKDYHPSEGMCTFGTTVRSLAGSERRTNLTQVAFAGRMNQRQSLSGDVLSVESSDSDMRSRLAVFISTYCDQADNGNGLGSLCKTAVPKASRRNIDVDYTRNIESRLTLDVDFLPTTQSSNSSATPKEDEQDVFALAANLYSHNIAPRMTPEDFVGPNDKIRLSYAEKYMDLRAIFAKRSVAQNSFAAITAMRASGAPESAPYTKALIKELGVKEDEIEKLVGKNPSYFAQMEILTKKAYQNPTFYTELYDKPANVQRKGAALQAIGLMQDRDLYNSLLRSEAVLSVLLETMLEKEQQKVVNSMRGSSTLTPESSSSSTTGGSK